MLPGDRVPPRQQRNEQQSGMVRQVVTVPHSSATAAAKNWMTQSDTGAGEAARIRERLARLDAERAELEIRLAELAHPRLPVREAGAKITKRSPTRDKIALFRSLFAGRKDLYPRRRARCARTDSPRPEPRASLRSGACTVRR